MGPWVESDLSLCLLINFYSNTLPFSLSQREGLWPLKQQSK